MNGLQAYEARMSMALVDCELRDLDRRMRRLKRTMQALLDPGAASAGPRRRHPVQTVQVVEQPAQ